MSPHEIAKHKSIYSFNLDNCVQDDLVELKSRCIKLENKNSVIEEMVINLRKDNSLKANDNVFDYGLDMNEKIKKAIEKAMLPIHEKINKNEEMLKNLLGLTIASMKSNLDNLNTLNKMLEGNKDTL
jgi:hypothetical protein